MDIQDLDVNRANAVRTEALSNESIGVFSQKAGKLLGQDMYIQVTFDFRPKHQNNIKEAKRLADKLADLLE